MQTSRKQKRMLVRNARDFGISIGQLPSGPTNSFADLEGVCFGQVTLSEGDVQTGVTVVHPAIGSMFEQKCIAACHVINGFGKSVGLMQLEELGQLETPIVLTNTLSVGTASSALVRHMLEDHPAIGETTGTVNPVVMECNDGAYLNDIRGMHVTEAHVRKALAMRDETLMHGAVGAGTGMSSYGLKGGIGSASRKLHIGNRDFTLAALTLCNMGRLPDLIVNGRPVGAEISELEKSAKTDAEKGSIIILLGTDLPLTARQLRRVCVRASAGLARTGTHFGSGSGDIALAFSTANRLPHDREDREIMQVEMLHEDAIDEVFRATIEAVEEAILNTLFASVTTAGKHGRKRVSLADWWARLSLSGQA